MSSVSDNTQHTSIKRGIETSDTPRSIGVIMDGNRRWASRHGLAVEKGYHRGYKKMTSLCQWAKQEGIEHLIVYAFSTENWDRSTAEVDALLDLFRLFFRHQIQSARKHGIRVGFLGERTQLPQDIRTAIDRIEKETEKNTELAITIAAPYGSRQEIIDAITKAYDKKGGLCVPSEKDVESELWTAGIPSPDLIVRTGGRKRLSNFLLWQSAYSELYFSDTLWPDFTQKEFTKVLYDYSLRKRTYGG